MLREKEKMLPLHERESFRFFRLISHDADQIFYIEDILIVKKEIPIDY
jgi:hypothetical protein